MTDPVVEPSTAPVAKTTNTLAIVSLVSSIVGLFSAGLGYIAGIVTGHIALSQIKKSGEEGRSLALSGLIVGYVGIGLSLLVLIGIIALIAIASAYGWDGGYYGGYGYGDGCWT